MPIFRTKKRRGAQRGAAAVTLNADEMSLARIEHAKHFSSVLLGKTAGNSTILRRALELYSEHLDKLLTRINQQPAEGEQADTPRPAPNLKNCEDIDERLRPERSAIQRANYGDTRKIPEEEIKVTPVKPLRDIVDEYRAAQPKPDPLPRLDLPRWAEEIQDPTTTTTTEPPH